MTGEWECYLTEGEVEVGAWLARGTHSVYVEGSSGAFLPVEFRPGRRYRITVTEVKSGEEDREEAG